MSKYFWFTLVFLYIFQSFANTNPSEDNSLEYLVNALIEINHPKALKVASVLEKIKKDVKTYNLIIRKADLNFNDIKKNNRSYKTSSKIKRTRPNYFKYEF